MAPKPSRFTLRSLPITIVPAAVAGFVVVRVDTAEELAGAALATAGLPIAMPDTITPACLSRVLRLIWVCSMAVSRWWLDRRARA
jgi:uncharacterized membrane protein